jgi:hypothetical protein
MRERTHAGPRAPRGLTCPGGARSAQPAPEQKSLCALRRSRTAPQETRGKHFGFLRGGPGGRLSLKMQGCFLCTPALVDGRSRSVVRPRVMQSPNASDGRRSAVKATGSGACRLKNSGLGRPGGARFSGKESALLGWAPCPPLVGCFPGTGARCERRSPFGAGSTRYFGDVWENFGGIRWPLVDLCKYSPFFDPR